MRKKSEDTLQEIEETQAALRQSIEVAKDLAEKSEQLVRQHRDDVAAERERND